MRRSLRALGALLIVGASVGTVGPGPMVAAGEGLSPVEGIVDVSSAIASLPTTVSPPGETVLLSVSVTNQGVVPTEANVLVDLVDGAVYRDELSSAECAADGADAICAAGSLAPGATTTFDVVANTAPVAGDQASTATAVVVGVVEPLEFQDNNTSTTSTEVLPAGTEYSAGLVEEGESLELQVADGRRYVLTVPDGVPGVIVRKLAPSAPGAKVCGAGACGDGFVLDFVAHPYFKAEDPTNPLITNRTFGPKDPCRGLSTKCGQIYYGKSEAQQVLTRMDDCAISGVAIPAPCINQRYKTDGQYWYDVRLLSNDPVELPPVLLGGVS